MWIFLCWTYPLDMYCPGFPVWCSVTDQETWEGGQELFFTRGWHGWGGAWPPWAPWIRYWATPEMLLMTKQHGGCLVIKTKTMTFCTTPGQEIKSLGHHISEVMEFVFQCLYQMVYSVERDRGVEVVTAGMGKTTVSHVSPSSSLSPLSQMCLKSWLLVLRKWTLLWKCARFLHDKRSSGSMQKRKEKAEGCEARCQSWPFCPFRNIT